MNRVFAAVLFFAACFQSHTGATAAILAHDYQLNGNLDDSLGGPSLVADGGSINATNYTFGANQGLQLSGGFGPLGSFSGNYSLIIEFSFDDFDPNQAYRKIVDFMDRTSDSGLYVLTESGASVLDLYANGDVGIGTTALTAGVQVEVALTRDALTQNVVGYVNGVQQFTYADVGNVFVFSATDNIARFFEDDAETSFGEAASGQADRIRIFHGALTADEVLDPPGAAVPEPASLVIWSLGALGCAVGAYHRRKRV